MTGPSSPLPIIEHPPKAILPGLASTHSFSSPNVALAPSATPSPLRRPLFAFFHHFYTILKIILLFLNYFLAQYDKFILSYFQPSVLSSLSLISTQYATLSGYSTGIVCAVLTAPVAYIADLTTPHAKIFSGLVLWWSLCVLFQGLSHNFSVMGAIHERLYQSNQSDPKYNQP